MKCSQTSPHSLSISRKPIHTLTMFPVPTASDRPTLCLHATEVGSTLGTGRQTISRVPGMPAHPINLHHLRATETGSGTVIGSGTGTPVRPRALARTTNAPWMLSSPRTPMDLWLFCGRRADKAPGPDGHPRFGRRTRMMQANRGRHAGDIHGPFLQAYRLRGVCLYSSSHLHVLACITASGVLLLICVDNPYPAPPPLPPLFSTSSSSSSLSLAPPLHLVTSHLHSPPIPSPIVHRRRPSLLTESWHLRFSCWWPKLRLIPDSPSLVPGNRSSHAMSRSRVYVYVYK